MFLIFQVVTVFLVAIAISMAVAHALELPGKNAPGPGKLHRRADHLLSGIRLGGNERGAEHDGYCHTPFAYSQEKSRILVRGTCCAAGHARGLWDRYSLGEQVLDQGPESESFCLEFFPPI
ncbi:MAG TPA: hypothetical protein VKB48_09870 [Candidatus Acidoferrum sp.]|nr:hypothetical protein [Candidatus Acidoferrum sp.]